MADDVSVPAFKKRANKASNIRKRPATPPPQHSDSESEYTSDDNDNNDSSVRVKRRRKDGVSVTAPGPQAAQDLSKRTTYTADRSATITVTDDATKTSTSYADASRTKPSNNGTETSNDGTYKGTIGYGSFIQKNAETSARQIGPLKAPSNVRTITTTDFAPDVCKDYKQTGFCGFGDNCKYLHAREDYAHGWQLDREWEKAGKGAKGTENGKDDGAKTEEEKMLENIPFACIICKLPYKMPVVTKCGHYFCEKCAMQRYMKEKKRACAACGADTNGTFQVARKLNELLEKKKQWMEDKAKAIEFGEEDEEVADG